MRKKEIVKANALPQAQSADLGFNAEILAGQLAPSSLAMYRRDFAAYLRFAGSPAAAIEAATLARWRTHLAQETDMSPNTINRMISAVKRLMREASIQGYVPAPAAAAFENIAGVKTAALKNRIKQTARVRIEPSAMRKMCDTPDDALLLGLRDTALLATLASSGLRVSEVVGLTTEQIRPKGSSYVVLVRGKNDVEVREAPLSREAYSHISTWLARRPVKTVVVFTSFSGRGSRATARPMSAVSIWRVVRKYSTGTGVDNVKPHDFRRFVGTQLARTNLRMAQKALGHKRLETTARHYILDELEAGLTDDLY
jgi:site-specific recombinase XerD